MWARWPLQLASTQCGACEGPDQENVQHLGEGDYFFFPFVKGSGVPTHEGALPRFSQILDSIQSLPFKRVVMEKYRDENRIKMLGRTDLLIFIPSPQLATIPYHV